MKTTSRDTDIRMRHLDKKVDFWRTLAIIFGLGCIGMGIYIIMIGG